MLSSISRDMNSFHRPHSHNDNHLEAIASPLGSLSVPKKIEGRENKKHFICGKNGNSFAHVVQTRTKLRTVFVITSVTSVYFVDIYVDILWAKLFRRRWTAAERIRCACTILSVDDEFFIQQWNWCKSHLNKYIRVWLCTTDRTNDRRAITSHSVYGRVVITTILLHLDSSLLQPTLYTLVTSALNVSAFLHSSPIPSPLELGSARVNYTRHAIS